MLVKVVRTTLFVCMASLPPPPLRRSLPKRPRDTDTDTDAADTDDTSGDIRTGVAAARPRASWLQFQPRSHISTHPPHSQLFAETWEGTRTYEGPPSAVPPKVLGIGAYGCVVRPVVPCLLWGIPNSGNMLPDEIANQGKFVGKLFGGSRGSYQASADHEFDVGARVRRFADPKGLFTIVPIGRCAAKPDPATWRACFNDSASPPAYQPQVVIPFGGPSVMDVVKLRSRQVGVSPGQVVADTKLLFQACGPIVMGLLALRTADVVHHDITPRNILYDARNGGGAKLIDFGISTNLDTVYNADLKDICRAVAKGEVDSSARKRLQIYNFPPEALFLFERRAEYAVNGNTVATIKALTQPGHFFALNERARARMHADATEARAEFDRLLRSPDAAWQLFNYMHMAVQKFDLYGLAVTMTFAALNWGPKGAWVEVVREETARSRPSRHRRGEVCFDARGPIAWAFNARLLLRACMCGDFQLRPSIDEACTFWSKVWSCDTDDFRDHLQRIVDLDGLD